MAVAALDVTFSNSKQTHKHVSCPEFTGMGRFGGLIFLAAPLWSNVTFRLTFVITWHELVDQALFGAPDCTNCKQGEIHEANATQRAVHI